MRRAIWPVFLVLAVMTTEASASGFRRSVVVQPSYYYTPYYSYYYVPYSPRIVYSAPVFVAPPITVAPYAYPAAAPASISEEPPRDVPSTALRSGESAYSVVPGPRGMEGSDGRCSVAFWNLTGRTLSLHIDGRDHVLSAGRSLTLEMPRMFAWHVSGREPEATRIAAGHATAEVFIRH